MHVITSGEPGFNPAEKEGTGQQVALCARALRQLWPHIYLRSLFDLTISVPPCNPEISHEKTMSPQILRSGHVRQTCCFIVLEDMSPQILRSGHVRQTCCFIVLEDNHTRQKTVCKCCCSALRIRLGGASQNPHARCFRSLLMKTKLLPQLLLCPTNQAEGIKSKISKGEEMEPVSNCPMAPRRFQKYTKWNIQACP